MAFFRGPNIVTDGLVFAIDAGSPRSYPGTGNIVNDIVKNHAGGTLSGGASVIDSNYFRFDGVNDSLQFATNDILNMEPYPLLWKLG